MRFSLFGFGLIFLVGTALHAEEKFTLRYQFHPGETLRWSVEQRTQMRTSVSQSTQDAETASFSVKTWHVKEVKADGTAVFEQLVEWVDMRQKLSGSQETRYDSRTDKNAPPGFQDVAAAVGVPLATITLDPQGKIVKREKKNVKGSSSQEGGEITLPLPTEPIAVGHVWTQPCDIDVPLQTGGVKKIKALQQFKLEEVQTGVATIDVSTQILTPITDPAIEAQVVQREGEGTVRFDIDAGRVLAQQRDCDKHVVGFRGGASSLHYVTRFSEQFMPQSTVADAKAGSDKLE